MNAIQIVVIPLIFAGLALLWLAWPFLRFMIEEARRYFENDV